MKKLIVFAVFGNNPIYTNGAYENLILQPKFYPDWVCRFYIDDLVPKNIVSLLEKDSEVIMMPRSDGFYGMWWRFEPFKDSTIERFIIRDSDSRLGIKEAAAVKEWEESGKEFHIMRDHQYHTQKIMGGMCGASSKFIDKIKDVFDNEKEQYLSRLSFQQLWHSTGKYYQTDQDFLAKYIWPRIINSHLAHIAPDRPQLKITGNEKMFPIECPNGFFIGYQDYMVNVPGYLQRR